MGALQLSCQSDPADTNRLLLEDILQYRRDFERLSKENSSLLQSLELQQCRTPGTVPHNGDNERHHRPSGSEEQRESELFLEMLSQLQAQEVERVRLVEDALDLLVRTAGQGVGRVAGAASPPTSPLPFCRGIRSGSSSPSRGATWDGTAKTPDDGVSPSSFSSPVALGAVPGLQWARGALLESKRLLEELAGQLRVHQTIEGTGSRMAS